MDKKVSKSLEEWRASLTPEQFAICREKGTERAFTGQHLDNKTAGVYACVCCDTDLFHSETKFDSGTGWPSFWAPAVEACVSTKEDRGLFMGRTEVLCAVCESHLGHVFEDGPPPTGLRYCVNSAALRFSSSD